MSQEEFERRVLALTQSLYRVCYSLLRREQDREDAVQSCILLAWERRRQLRDPEKFRPWIMRILVNCCRSQLRRTQRELPGGGFPFAAACAAAGSIPGGADAAVSGGHERPGYGVCAAPFGGGGQIPPGPRPGRPARNAEGGF